MEVKNLAWNENLSKRCNDPLLPQGIRGLLIGKSGCRKIALPINLLLRPGWLDYNNINIFGKSLFQNEITYLDISPDQLLKKWRKRLEINLMLSAIFINRLEMFLTPEN